MSLLISFEAHNNALIEILGGVSIPKEIISKTLAATIKRIVEANKISLQDDELQSERDDYNKAFHIAVKYYYQIVNRVLIDGGFGYNICPFL